MKKVAPSVLVREELDRLLQRGGAPSGGNIVSQLVDTVTRLVVQELLEAEQTDLLGARGRYEPRGQAAGGMRNGYETGSLRTAEGSIDVRVPQVRDAGQPFRSTLMGFLEGNSDVLEDLVTEMYARGLSTRDVEDAFTDATGRLLISKSAVSEITDRIWEQYQDFCARDLSDVDVEYLFVDAIFGVAAPARCQGSRAGGLGHRLRRVQASAESGGGQQGVRDRVDRVLPAHGQPGAAGPDHRHLRRRTGAGQRDRVGVMRLAADPLLVPPSGQHPVQAARRRCGLR